MSPKAIGIVLLAMSGSFVTILAVLGYALAGDGPQRPSRRGPAVRPATIAAPPAIRSHPDDRQQATTTPSRQLDVPRQAQALPDSAVTLPPVPTPVPDVSTLANATDRRLQGVEAALAKQVAALKRSRDEMLDELAGELARTAVTEATTTLSTLDDETAALTLKRLGSARRAAILRALPAKRRATIERQLRSAGG